MTASASTTGSRPPKPPTLAAGAPAVLIVEPMPDQQWKLARMFTVQGYRVVGSASVTAARALLRRFQVDLILLSEHGCESLLVDVTELQKESPAARVVVMGEGDEARHLATLIDGVECVSRPSRMQDLEAFDTAVA